MEYYYLLASATSKEEASKIAYALLEDELTSGVQIYPAHNCFYKWKGELVQELYFNVTGFTVKENKDKIVEKIKSMHSDEVPAIIFTKIEASYSEFLNWIHKNTKIL